MNSVIHTDEIVSTLAKSERKLAAAVAAQFEAFYATGVILDRIRVDKEFRDAGFDSFEDYMDESQPCDIKKATAYKIIAAMKLRPILPSVSHCETGSTWTQRSIEPLTHKDFTPSDQKRLGKKIATRVKNGEKLTTTLVKEICDADRGVERKKKERQSAELSTTQTAAEVLAEMSGQALLWQQSLDSVSREFWQDAESDDPGCAKRTTDVFAGFTDFCRRVVGDAESEAGL